MVRVGRYTSAFILLAVGVALLLDQTTGSAYLLQWLGYWPAVLIVLGVEYLIASLRIRNGERRMRMEFGALILAVIVAVAVSGVFHGKAFADRYDMSWDRFTFQWGSGDKYEKPVQTAALSDRTNKLVIDNPNGNVSLVVGTADTAEIRPTVVLFNQSADKAEKLVQESRVDVTEGGTIKIDVEGARYAPFVFEQKARVDLVVALPADRPLDVEVKTRNGDIRASGIAIDTLWKASTSNGDVTTYDLEGDVQIETSNGDVEMMRITGTVRARTSNGDVHMEDVSGNAVLRTSNGEITAEAVTGDLDAETSNGDVEMAEVAGEVRVVTNNGDIEASSSTVGGDWTIETSNGDIELLLPQDGDYKVDARTGRRDGKTDIPGLRERERSIEGEVGTGRYLVKAKSNGKVEIHALR